MFTGIIESFGVIESVITNGTGKTFTVSSSLSPELKIDQSLSHNGVCLTIESVTPKNYQVTAIIETLNKTTLGSWKEGTRVNLERCMQLNGRLDGHIVQGHVDTTGKCLSKKDLNGSWEYRFSFPENFASLIIEKGSICLDGISLTAYDVTKNEFSIAVIPYTYENTNISKIEVNDTVNLEFDVVGKYIQRNLSHTAIVSNR